MKGQCPSCGGDCGRTAKSGCRYGTEPEKPAHTDHPMRHYDRTCPACQKDDGEPVAWLYWNKASKELRVCQLAEHDADDFPVYTHPAPKPWVGLTEEEVNALYTAGMGIHATIEATEEKLKEKNT